MLLLHLLSVYFAVYALLLKSDVYCRLIETVFIHCDIVTSAEVNSLNFFHHRVSVIHYVSTLM